MDTRQIRKVELSEIHHLPMIDFIGNDFAIFNDIKEIPLSTYPTRLNAACLAVCLKGWAKFELNLEEHEMREGMMSIILPEQIVLHKEYSDDFSGLFIAISKDFMNMVIPSAKQLFPMLFIVKEHPFIPVTTEELRVFQEYHSFLWSKVRLRDNSFRKEITQGLLLALFYEIYNIYQRGVDCRERVPKNRKEELFDRFIRTVSESYKQERSVSFYADKLFLTSKHLSTVVKEISGKTAGEWIDSLVVLEAKALLKSSDLSIQEIADELHFANQSFFGKYFKHHTGMSPKAYRQQ